MNADISQVIEDGLCTGCGTCVALCPQEAISYEINKRIGNYDLKIDSEKCTDCGICLRVCPGREVNFAQLSSEIFGSESEDVLLGDYRSCYRGYSDDKDIRYNSTSGGLITSLLIFALEEGIIDGALVTRMKKDSPLEPEPFIARTREEIIEASKSKYCPVPANIALKEILKAGDAERFAVVGVSCQIQGLRKAESVNSALKQKIVLHLGLQCGHTDSFLMSDFILRWFKINASDVQSFDYRGNGWPGAMSIGLKDGRKKIIPFMDYIVVHELGMFTPRRCLLCWDKLNSLDDITFGDLWMPGIKDNPGISIAISRNEIAERLLQSAMSSGNLNLIKMSEKEISQWQPSPIWAKQASAARSLFSAIGQKTPSYNISVPQPDFFSYALLTMQLLGKFIGSKRSLWGFTCWMLPRERAIIRKLNGMASRRKAERGGHD